MVHNRRMRGFIAYGVRIVTLRVLSRPVRLDDDHNKPTSVRNPRGPFNQPRAYLFIVWCGSRTSVGPWKSQKEFVNAIRIPSDEFPCAQWHTETGENERRLSSPPRLPPNGHCCDTWRTYDILYFCHVIDHIYRQNRASVECMNTTIIEYINIFEFDFFH